jgi:lipopolysaccharide/colanic/teichoic acid biosynthesis glycosyltransferase
MKKLKGAIMSDFEITDGIQITLTEDVKSEFDKCRAYFLFKRIIDVLGVIVGIVLFLPVFFITAIAIKVESTGPVFFIQERVGLNGRLFNMYKFRSMCDDAECKLDELQEVNEMSGPMFKMKCDPRVTKIGKVIRKTSIDELPQLFNILKGEMSFVGPRPNLLKEVVQYTDAQKLKLIAKPGLTCYWQVGGRNDVDFEEWMELDVKYIRERNTLVDIRLIFKTIGVLFGDENAH